MERIRLNQYLAQCGVCSRREADRLIGAGKVAVNGETARIGGKVCAGDQVCVNGKMVEGQNKKVVLAYYKPRGVTCTERDRFAEKTVSQCVDYPVRVTYAGRLDKDSEGLLLLTNDGALIQNMMRASCGHEKEYAVRIKREVTREFVRKMGEGVYLEELGRRTRPCGVTKEGKNTFRIVLTQGMNRQIRRMCAALGEEAVRIKRLRVLNITLEGLKEGELRQITGGELSRLYQMAGMQVEDGSGKRTETESYERIGRTVK